MRWTARFTKRSKDGSGHGENPRNAQSLYRKHPWKPQEYYKIIKLEFLNLIYTIVFIQHTIKFQADEKYNSKLKVVSLFSQNIDT